MKRYGSIIKAMQDKPDEYKQLHTAAWPGVLEQIWRSNIRNHAIFNKDGMLFSYFEYIGIDYKKDMAAMVADPVTQEWWKVCIPCQVPVETRKMMNGGLQ